MSEDEIKYDNSVKRPDRPEEQEDHRQEPGEETEMDDRAAEFVFRIFRDQNAEKDPTAAVDQWTQFLSACRTDWILNPAGDAEDPDPAVRIVNARMVHTGMGIRKQDIWLDVQAEYTGEHGEYLNRFSGRMNSPFFGFEAEHPTLLVGPIPAGDDPLGEILKHADDQMFSFRWLDGTHYRAIPCIDRRGSLLICDLKNMDRIDIKKTNAALTGARSMLGATDTDQQIWVEDKIHGKDLSGVGFYDDSVCEESQSLNSKKSDNINLLMKIGELKNGWNGDCAKGFDKALIDKAVNIVNEINYQPEIFPTACGTIQMEYEKKDGSYLELEVSDDDNIKVFSVDKNGHERTNLLGDVSQEINEMVDSFYGRM